MRGKITFISIAFYLFFALMLFSAPETISVGTQFTDTNGNLLHAHGGGVLKSNGYYYWYGENRQGDLLVSCYRSTDLKNWEFRNHVLKRSTHSELSNANIERPKVIYNPRTNRFIMWMHKELTSDYGQARAAIATCGTADGNYTWVRSFRPLDNMSRDCTAFVDDDGRAYFISAANENYDLHIYRLTADFQNIESLVYKFVGDHREAPAIFKYSGTYFLITSGATGWNPNQGKYSTARSLSGSWSSWQNLGNGTTYDSQPTYILPVQGSEGTSYLYMGDRWAGAWSGPVNDSRYVWLPIILNSSTSISLNNAALITIDTEKGKVSGGEVTVDPANIAHNKAASASSEESGNPARNGNDSSYGTRWCANDGNTGHWWKVDLGQEYNITEVSVFFEFGDVYEYLVESSVNNSTWSNLVDQRNTTSTRQSRTHAVNTRTRYVRITYTGLASGRWASHYEFIVKADAQATPTPASTPTATVRKGDVNRDGTVNIVDALMTAQFYVGSNPSGFYQPAADVNNDGAVTIVDALMIAQYYVGLITVFPG